MSASSKLRIVAFGGSFDWPLTLPPALEVLLFSPFGAFNHSLTFTGNRLRLLQLSESFNHVIELLEGLESVYFGRDYSQQTDLPNSLTKLEFSSDSVFNQHLDLPIALEYASFGESMIHPVTFPIGLEDLEWYSDCPLNLPDGLQRLKLGPDFAQPLILPRSLREVEVSSNYVLPLALPSGCEQYIYDD